MFGDKGCTKLYIKQLSPNDNSKNQVYFGGSFDVLNIFPIQEITSHDVGDWKRERFKTRLNYFWLNNEGQLYNAPDAQLILYPKYPEVRFSGFLKGVKNAPSDLMASRIERRLLFLGISHRGEVIGYVAAPESEAAVEFNDQGDLDTVGVFKEITLVGGALELNTKNQLIQELKRIHKLGWIDTKRLDSGRNILPCVFSNCGGYTLEAELGVAPNSYSEPDYLGWEIKQFAVKDFRKFDSSIVTLMTPEPTHGFYVSSGVEDFIRKYGYVDKLGREARLNFGGIHKFNSTQVTTRLKLIIQGFNTSTNKITSTEGFIGLLDTDENIAASWSFISLLKHWNTKHANACYVPSRNRKHELLYPFSKQQYQYGDTVMLGIATDFSLMLGQVALGNIYYDPGIKLELAIEGIRKQNVKRRSQFRIKSAFLPNLYKKNEIIDLTLIN